MGLVRLIQPTDGHGTVLGATLDQLANPVLQPCDTGPVVGRILFHGQLHMSSQAVPLLLLLGIGGGFPGSPEGLAGAEAIGVLVEVGDQVIAEGVLCFHGVDYTGPSGNGKRLAIGNSNHGFGSDSRGSNAQVRIRAPVLRLL